MSLADTLSAIKADKPEKGKAQKKYVQFNLEEWESLEKAYGKSIDPADVKKLVIGIFSGVFDVRPMKPAKPA